MTPDNICERHNETVDFIKEVNNTLKQVVNNQIEQKVEIKNLSAQVAEALKQNELIQQLRIDYATLTEKVNRQWIWILGTPTLIGLLFTLINWMKMKK